MQPLATKWRRKKSSGHKLTQRHGLQTITILNNERLWRSIEKYFFLLQWTRITWKFILHLKHALNLFYSQSIIYEYLAWLQTGAFTLQTSNFLKSLHVHILTHARPGQSFGLKFIPNQSDLFRFIPKSVSAPSELIRFNPKKVFHLVWCKSVKDQSVSIWVNPRFLILIKIQSDFIRLNRRLPIQINPKEVSNWILNPNQSE